MKQAETKSQPVNKEAFKMLAMEIGLNEAARKLGIPIPTAKSWAQRGKWKLPKRKGGGVPRSLPASTASSAHPIADALSASHEELEGATKTALMQALAKAAQAVAEREALDVSNTAQLRDICLAAARIFGWNGDSQVNVAVNNQVGVGVVLTEEQRQRLIELRRGLLAERPAMITLPAPQTQPQANVGTRNGNPAPADGMPSATFSAPAGMKAPSDASPTYRTWLEYERPEPEPGPENEI